MTTILYILAGLAMLGALIGLGCIGERIGERQGVSLKVRWPNE